MATQALSHIHVIEPDVHRRATIFIQFKACSIHAEIYESVAEFCEAAPDKGGILANHDADDVSAPELIETITACSTFLPLALFSENPTPHKVVEAVLSGAVDYLAWPFDCKELQQACTRLSDSEWHVRREARRAEARALVVRLSIREREVLQHLLEGGSNKEIARALDISPRTVEIHRSHLMHKLDAHSTAEVIRIGLLADLG